jgi:DNA-binding IclR family transcriptional regulator
VLDALDSAGQPVAFADLAARVELPRSSLHNICTSLASVGIIERGQDGRWQIGLRVVELARSRLKGLNIVNAFHYVARSIPSPWETVVLSVRHGSDVTYLSIIHGDHPVAVRYEIGMRLPAAFTASGKAILATLPDAKVREVIGQVARSDVVAGAPKPVEALLRELHEIRQRGFSVDDEETARGMICAGAAVRAGDESEAVGAVAFSSVKAGSDLNDMGARIQRLAASVSAQLGANLAVP